MDEANCSKRASGGFVKYVAKATSTGIVKMEFLFLVAFLVLVIYSFRKWPKSKDKPDCEDCDPLEF